MRFTKLQEGEAADGQLSAFASQDKGVRIAFAVITVALCIVFGAVCHSGSAAVMSLGWLPLVMVEALVVGAFASVLIAKDAVVFPAETVVGTYERGRNISLQLCVENKSFVPVMRAVAHWQVLDAAGQVAEEGTCPIALAPYGKAEVSLSATLDHVGTYKAAVDQVMVTGFLGLFHGVACSGEEAQEINVVPSVQPMPRAFSALRTETPRQTCPQETSEFAFVYAGAAGDAVPAGLSSKADAAVAAEEEDDEEVAVVVDAAALSSDSEDARLSVLDTVATSACSLASQARLEGMDSRLLWVTDKGALETVFPHEQEKIAALVKDSVACEKPALLSGALAGVRPEKNRRVVVCSGRVDSSLVQALTAVKQRGVNVQLLAAAPAGIDDFDMRERAACLRSLGTPKVPFAMVAGVDRLGEVALR